MTDSISQTLGLRLRELREKRELTLQEVADRASLSKSHVWEMEQGRGRNPTIDTVMRLAGVFGVSLDYLTGIAGNEPALHPEALRIACEVDALLKSKATRCS